jgi:hypothetical protein
MIQIPVSIGELFDRVTILSIKMKHITDADKLRNINLELNALEQILQPYMQHPEFKRLYDALYNCNLAGWRYEDEIRDRQRMDQIDQEFAEITNATHLNNDNRMRIKRAINATFNSSIIEEKSYKEFS